MKQPIPRKLLYRAILQLMIMTIIKILIYLQIVQTVQIAKNKKKTNIIELDEESLEWTI